MTPPNPSCTVRYAGRPSAVRFLSRPNRYLARVALVDHGEPFEAHVPNPGRMGELLLPNRTRGYIIPAGHPGRRTSFDLVSVYHGGELVSIDTRIANRIVGKVLAAGGLPEFGAGPWRSEPTWGRSRFDFGVPDPEGGYRALLEVKSSNLRVGSAASFPDAPTVRGSRHVRELTRAARAGRRAGVVFVVQRSDVDRFRPNSTLDPEFARALRRAAAAGVLLRANLLRVTPGGARWGPELPISLV